MDLHALAINVAPGHQGPLSLSRSAAARLSTDVRYGPGASCYGQISQTLICISAPV